MSARLPKPRRCLVPHLRWPDDRMEKAPGPSHAHMGEERTPLRKVGIYHINSV
jgi:hypothetical protein